MQNNTRNYCYDQNIPPKRIRQTRQGVQRRTIATTPETYDMGSRDRTTPRSTHYDARTTPPSKSKRNWGGSQVCTRTSCTRNNTRIMERLRRKLLLCKEKGRETTAGTRLSTDQQMDHEKSKRLSPNSPGHWQVTRMHPLHKSRRPMGI